MVAAIFVVAIVVGLVLAFVRLTNAKVWTGTTRPQEAAEDTRDPEASTIATCDGNTNVTA